MFLAIIISSFIAAPVILLALQYRSLQKNLVLARASGLTVVVSPFHFMSQHWVLLQEVLAPLLHSLPSEWTESWLPLAKFSGTWRAGYDPFDKLKEDSFIVASPGGNTLWTCDPEVVNEVSTRRVDFQKSTEVLELLNNYGPTLTASEGETAHRFRKIAAPVFSERNHGQVWKESLLQTGMMLKKWNEEDQIIHDLGKDSDTLALHVLCKVFFNKDLEWVENNKAVPTGHTLTFKNAIRVAFKYNLVLFITPRFLLDYSPLSMHKRAKEGFQEWRKYMEELRDEAEVSLREQPKESDKLVHQFVKAGAIDLTIAPEAVLGNIFIFVLAGHESSAATLWISVTILACKPQFQKALQKDIDSILNGRAVEDLEYPTDYVRLVNGHVGALMKETLRQYPVATFLPKTNPDKQQIIKSGANSYMLPPDTLILLNTCAAHRNPKIWPESFQKDMDEEPYPVSNFDPEIWLPVAKADSSAETRFNPPPGAYIPFAEGSRSCMGKVFSQVEFCATMVGILSKYNITLANGPSNVADLRAAEQALSAGIGFEMGLKMKGLVRLRVSNR